MEKRSILLALLSICIFACSNTAELEQTGPVPIVYVPPTTTGTDEESLLALEPFATGDTITVPVKPDLDLAWQTNVDLKPLSGKANADFVYTAIGGGITAGWRDGGLYRQGQQSSFPNLVAHQMGLVNFKNPLFSPEKGNGTGYKVYNADRVQWDYVGNNTAIEQKVPLKLEKHLGGVNNFGMPKMPIISGTYKPTLYENPKSHDVYFSNKRFMVYIERLLPREEEERVSLVELVDSKNGGEWPDFFTVELGVEDLVHNYLNGYGGYFPNTNVVDPLKNHSELLRSGAKGIVCTVPDMLQTPYFNTYLNIDDYNSGVYGTWGNPLHILKDDGYRLDFNQRIKEWYGNADVIATFDRHLKCYIQCHYNSNLKC